MRQLRVAALQLASGRDRERNLQRIAELVAQAAAQGCELVALPEVANLRAEPVQLEHAEPVPGPTTLRLSELAQRHRIWVHGGSLLERSTEAEPRVFNTSVVLDPDGQLAARYRKIHLFDVDLDDGSSHRESRMIAPGDEVVTTCVGDVMLGLSVCYDVRFPELYRQLAQRGARVLFVPSAFTEVTGRAHWEILLRARAIENQAFVVAPAQAGAIDGASACYGHSMIVGPWGDILAEAPDADGECVVVADLDFDGQDRLRTNMPVLEHQRITTGACRPT